MAYSPRIVSLNGNTSYHVEVRGRLGVDTGTLPDTDIDAPSVLPIAESKVVSRVPNYASLTGDDQSYVYAAAVAMVAAVLAPSMGSRIKASEGDSDYKYTNTPVDWKVRAKQLEDDAYGFIDLISTQIAVGLPQIAVAGPTRAHAPSGDPTIISGDILLYPTNVQ